MVDEIVKEEVESILIESYPDLPHEVIRYLFRCRVLDINKCRIAIIKRHYYSLIEQGMSAAEAKAETGARFCRSEKTIENLIYNEFYRDIKF